MAPTVETSRSTGPLWVSGPEWMWTALVGAFATAVAAAHGSGPGFLLDDWFLVGNVATGGASGVVSPDLALSRPGSFPTYFTSFGLAAGNPRVVQLVQAAHHVRILEREVHVVGQVHTGHDRDLVTRHGQLLGQAR